MLRRVDLSTFEAPTGSTVRVVAVARNNAGAEDARFRYGSVLPAETIQGHPGCTFNVDVGPKTLGCTVVFAPGAETARYDLFEVADNGQLSDLQEPIVPGDGPVRQLRIRGAQVAVLAAAATKAKARKKAKKVAKKAAKKVPKKVRSRIVRKK